MRRRVSKILAIVLMMTMTMSSVSFAVEPNAEEKNLYMKTAHYDNLWNDTRETVNFYYLDSYFSGDATKYNKHLATASMALNMAGGSGLSDTKECIRNIDYKDIENSEYTYPRDFVGNDRIGYVLAQRNLENSNTVVIVAVIRGSSYGTEWIQNFNAGVEGNAEGFEAPAQKVAAAIKNKAEKIKNGKTVKIWITGYSRGGAVANLAAKILTDDSDFGSEKVYAYTFEAPKGANPPDAKYTNIHNVVNVNDGIALVMPSYMGFGRYGVDREIGDGNYADMEAMLDKICGIRKPEQDGKPDKKYVDINDFQWGEFKLNIDLNSPHLISDIIKVAKTKEIYSLKKLDVPAEPIDFWNLAVKRLRKVVPTRDSYAKTDIQSGFMSLMYIIFSLSDEQKELLKDSVLDAKTLISLVSDMTLVKAILDVQDGKTPRLTDNQYKEMGEHIYNSIISKMDELAQDDADSKLIDEQKEHAKNVCNVLLKPVLTILADDYNSNHQLIGTIMAGDNLGILTESHYYDINMAWLMTQDSYYNGYAPTADNYQDADQAPVPVTETDITKMCSIKKGFEVQWEQQSENLDGYQIQYSTDKKFGDVTKISIKDPAVTKQKVTNLKPWRRYYVRVRCFKVVDGVRFYGGWSTTKSRITRLLWGRG